MLPSIGSANVGINEKFGLPIVVYGGNLSEAEKESVAKSLDVAGEADVEEIEVTGQDLITYIKDGDSRANMYSSAKITRKDAGEGLVIQIVTPDNITQVTTEMYANAMLTAGIEDATVEVAAPKAVTGHSALVGIYKAYEVNGEELDPERTDVANDELTVATELADSGVEDAKVSELLTEIKKQIAERDVDFRHVEQQENHRRTGQRNTEIEAVKAQGITHWAVTVRQSEASMKPSICAVCGVAAEINKEAP